MRVCVSAAAARGGGEGGRKGGRAGAQWAHLVGVVQKVVGHGVVR